MDQTIGIKYAVSGQEKVFETFNQLDSHLDRLDGKLKAFSAQMRGFGNVGKSGQGFGGISQIATHLEKAGVGANQFTRALERGAVAAQGLHASVNATAAAAQKLATIKIPAMVGGPGPGDKGAPGTALPRDRQTLAQGIPYIGRWFAMYAGGGGAYHTFKDVGLGASRKELMAPMRDVMAVDFDKDQRRQIEIRAHDFKEKFVATGTVPEYLKGVSEVGSRFNVNDPKFKGRGVDEIAKMTEAGAILGAVGRLGTQQATNLLMNTLKATTFQMPEAERLRYEKGEKSYGALAEAQSGKIAKTMQETAAWGPDIQQGMQYALPSLMAKGWSLDTILSYIGTMKSAGYPGQKAGISLRSMAEAEMGKFGVAQLAGAEDPKKWAEYKALKGQEQKDYRAKLAIGIKERMKTDPWGLMSDLGKWMDTAESRGIDIKEHVGLPQRWLGTRRVGGKEGFVKEGQALEERLKGVTSLKEQREKVMEFGNEPGFMTEKLSDSWTALKQSLGRDTPLGGMVDSWVETINMIRKYNDESKKFNPATALREGKDFMLHGLGEGLYDTVQKFQEQIKNELNLPFMPGQLPELDKLKAIPNDIQAKLQSAVASGEQFFDKLNQWGLDRAAMWKDAFAEAGQALGISKAAPGLVEAVTSIPDLRPKVGPAPEMYSPKNYVPDPGLAPTDEDLKKSPFRPASLETSEGGGERTVNVKVYLDGRELHGVVFEALEDVAMHNRQRWGGSRFS